MTTTIKTGSARERILQAASELFYTIGYRGAAVNDIIARANVAKATFYAHFESKEALCVEYLTVQNNTEMAELRDAIDAADSAYEKFMAPARQMEFFSAVNDQRGCRFLNMAAEIPATDSALRKPGVDHYARVRTLLVELSRNLKASNAEGYAHMHAEATADAYLLLIGGGLAIAELYNQLWPARHVVYSVEQLARPQLASAASNQSQLQII